MKPENIMVAQPKAGEAKLVDFGIARVAGERTLTGPGAVLGTLAYMAPEQADGQRPGPAADVYSLAITLYECFCGEHPLIRENAAATARAIGEEIIPLGFIRPDLPPQLADVIDSCLDPDPELRPLASELEAVLMAHSRELTDVALPAVLRPEEIDPERPALRPPGGPPEDRHGVLGRRARLRGDGPRRRHDRPRLRPAGGAARRRARPRPPEGRLRRRRGGDGRVARARRRIPGRRAGRRPPLRAARPAAHDGRARGCPAGGRAAAGPDRDRPRLPGPRGNDGGDRRPRPPRRPRLPVARRVGGRLRHHPGPRPRDGGPGGLERVRRLGAGRRLRPAAQPRRPARRVRMGGRRGAASHCS